MGGPYYLGLDVGTQGTKGVVTDASTRRVVARASHAYDLIEGLPPGAAEQHPDRWIEAITRVATDLWSQQPHRRDDLAAIGVSGQQHVGTAIVGQRQDRFPEPLGEGRLSGVFDL